MVVREFLIGNNSPPGFHCVLFVKTLRQGDSNIIICVYKLVVYVYVNSSYINIQISVVLYYVVSTFAAFCFLGI